MPRPRVARLVWRRVYVISAVLQPLGQLCLEFGVVVANLARSLVADSEVLDRFLRSLPYKPSCGDDKACQLIRSRPHAIRYPYIQPNPPQMQHWIVLDLDFEDLAEDKYKEPWQQETLFSLLESETLPCPNFAVMNRHNRNCHIYFAIEPVCTSVNGRKGPKLYLDAVTRGLNARFKGDSSFTQRNAKNPFSSVWETVVFHSDVYSLGELADYVELTSKPWFGNTEDKPEPAGRNCALFEELRQWAYREVKGYRQQSTFEHWHQRVLLAAESLNYFPGNSKGSQLPYSEVKSTAKSVAKWTWDHYQGGAINRGVMDLEASDLPLENRQRLAARRTHQVRRENTEARIKEAISILKARNERVTKAAAARLAGLSRQHVTSHYSHLFDSPTPAKKAADRPRQSVFYGVHQVTAVRSEKSDKVVVLPLARGMGKQRTADIDEKPPPDD